MTVYEALMLVFMFFIVITQGFFFMYLWCEGNPFERWFNDWK